MAPENASKPRKKNAVVPGTLYLVATPIGNMADLSERAIKILSEVDFVAAEDTRNSGLLLSRLGITRPLVSYFEHNKRERGPYIVSRLQNGEACALVTDAGTPAISDPGEDLVALCAEAGVNVTSVPGCCAAITALTLSGLPTRRFCFEGFFTGTKSGRQKRLDALAGEERTMLFYEAPHHLRQTLAALLAAFGDRKIALCRELTKLHGRRRCPVRDEGTARGICPRCRGRTGKSRRGAGPRRDDDSGARRIAYGGGTCAYGRHQAVRQNKTSAEKRCIPGGSGDLCGCGQCRLSTPFSAHVEPYLPCAIPYLIER